MGNEMPSRTEEERKKALASAFSRVTIKVDNKSNESSVNQRLEAIANRPDETNTGEKTSTKKTTMSLYDAAVAEKDNATEMKKAGIGLVSRETLDREDKKKEKEKEKEKDKNKDKSSKSADDKKKEAAQLCKLPSGYEIKEVAGKYMLVNPRFPDKMTDVTKVFDEIANYNEEVEAVNRANAGASPNEPKKDIITHDDKVNEVSESLPNVKDTNGKDVFNQGDLQAVAEFAVSKAESEMKREMEEQMKDNDNKNREDDDNRAKKTMNKDLYQKSR